MFTFHGWFVIAETTYDYDIGGLDTIITNLRILLSQTTWPSGFAEIRPLNGIYYLYMGGNTNRPLGYHATHTTILQYLAVHAPGSYGLLYWQDDEDDSPPGNNNFHVRVLARGKIEHRFDPFLSPAVPMIEDAEKSSASA